jgi:hypothetical protein
METGLLYHGTTDRYYARQLQIHGRYEHAGEKVYLSVDFATPMNYAIKRAEFYAAKPILLVINESLITSNLECYPFLVCDFLLPEWYGILLIESADKKISEKTLLELKQLEKAVLNRNNKK